MGYTTEFSGSFKTDVPVSDKVFNLINGLASTRRMKRADLPPEYGIDGEFYIEDDDNFGQPHNTKLGRIVNYNMPPDTQPGLWLQWKFDDDKQTIIWDGSEKFYKYVEWIDYLIQKILKPNGYNVNGKVHYQGESRSDHGVIEIINNDIIVIEE